MNAVITMNQCVQYDLSDGVHGIIGDIGALSVFVNDSANTCVCADKIHGSFEHFRNCSLDPLIIRKA